MAYKGLAKLLGESDLWKHATELCICRHERAFHIYMDRAGMLCGGRCDDTEGNVSVQSFSVSLTQPNPVRRRARALSPTGFLNLHDEQPVRRPHLGYRAEWSLGQCDVRWRGMWGVNPRRHRFQHS